MYSFVLSLPALLLASIMVDLNVYAFSPSSPVEQRRQRCQAETSNSGNAAGQSSTRSRTAFLVPSQAILKASHKDELFDVHDISINQDDAANKSVSGSEETKTHNSKPDYLTTTSTKKQAKHRRSQRFGNFPDIYWRSVSMEHLREHPHFDSLPARVTSINSLEDVKSFRQDSWQWDALHRGRCTTSQASAALGFLEPQAATALYIPKSWQRGGLGAYYRLRDEDNESLQTLEEMQQVLLENDEEIAEGEPPAPSNKNIWSQATLSPNFPFPAKYLVKMTPEERKQRKRHASNKRSTLSTKMSWGNAQEATSLLTALNYLWKEDPDVRLEEVGMCGAGLFSNDDPQEQQHKYQKLPPLGASPDALIRHSNGTKEVLEVKNHCPFYTTKKGRQNSPREDFAIKSFPFSSPHLPPLYVPQMMMEMLCVGATSDDGKNCNSAVMVRQTATTGALVMRLQRDDQWIDEMLYWLQEFQTRFVEPGTPPPTNFFWNDDNESSQERYRAFVQHTKDVADSVEVLCHVQHKDIQRMQGTGPNTTSLFLD